MPNDANHRQFRRLNSTLTETGRDILQTLATSEEALSFVVCPSQLVGPVQFGSVDTDAFFFLVEYLDSQRMGPTPRPRLRAHPCAPLGIPMNVMNKTCGTLCWDFSVMCNLAYLWSRTLMKLFWGGSHSPVTLRSIYYVTSRTLLQSISEARFRGSTARCESL